MSDYNLLIDGQMVPGDLTMPVLNPATEEVLVQCPRASKDQLDKAVAAAKAAYPAWAATPIEERRKLVVKMAEAIEANVGELARLLTSEQGKPLADATGEVMGMAAFFRYLGSLDLPMRVIEDSGDRRIEAHRRPLGVVAPSFPGTIRC
jgi:acyl-CoA reductase-like NAD-dependent aldehyde dehydrogenase